MVEATAEEGAREAAVGSVEQASVTGRPFVVMDLCKSILPVV